MAVKNYNPTVVYYGIDNSPSNYLAVGTTGMVSQSTDAWNWSYVANIGTQLNDITYNSVLDKYIAVGSTGKIVSCVPSNTKVWTTLTSKTSANLFNISDISTAYDVQTSSTSLLMHFTGASFVDSSPFAQTVTVVGNTTISSTQSVFGGSSAYFDGAGDYLTLPDSSTWDFTGAFTIETWYMATGNSGLTQAIVSNFKWSVGTNSGWILTATPGTGKVIFRANDGVNWNSFLTTLTGTTTIQLNTWYHIAVTRDSSNTLRLFVNGVLEASTTLSYNPLNIQNDPLRIGCDYGDGEGKDPVFGYIDEMRIVKDAAMYTSNFTVPTSELAVYTTTQNITTNLISVGASGAMVVSVDGITWYAGTTGTTTQLNCIATNGTNFVIVGASGLIRYSTDLTNWTTATSGTTNALVSVAYGNGRYVAVGASGSVCYSTDGINWSHRNVSSSGLATNTHSRVVFNNYTFISTATNGVIAASTDGYTWGQVATVPVGMYGLVSKGYTTVTVGNSGQIYRTRT